MCDNLIGDCHRLALKSGQFFKLSCTVMEDLEICSGEYLWITYLLEIDPWRRAAGFKSSIPQYCDLRVSR